jgi:hypothetical protein
MKAATRRTKVQERTPALSESLPSGAVLIGLPSETIAAGYAQPDSIGLPIMPDGFVVDTGFLTTAKIDWR